MLHMTRIAWGCDTVPDLLSAMAGRARDGRLYLTTRYRPKRAEEILAGGSLYWIVKHRLVARAPVLAFEEAPEGRCNIVLDARPLLVLPTPKRAHQGWRYLQPADAPPDLSEAGEGLEALPGPLSDELAVLGLL